ncbi:DNA polymerase beta superfamily protein [Terribacillus saccharophilus]|uniref:nucleotidyltransferase domain-containing protein n=1 Tax=Terribacillus saccharophilus TaxID=361277 RepID=UPI003981E48C
MVKKLQSSGHDWLEERTIILAPTGSHAYGTNTEDSDKDYKGICIPPVSYFLGLESFNEYNSSGGKNFKNTKDDVDINIIHITKFVKDAMVGVPNNIEILFLNKDQYIKLTDLGQQLIDNRHLFLSKAIQKKFGGYAKSQIQKLKLRNDSRAGRQDLIDLYGYDTKFFMHSVRLLTSAIEILETGDFSTYRPNRGFLLDCRNGKYNFGEAVELIESLDDDLKKAANNSALPEMPDYNAINQLLIRINSAAIN